MKRDLDLLMQKRDLAALVVVGESESNVARTYLSNGAHVTGGYILKKRGEAPVMIVNAMETEEAAKSGLRVLSYFDLGWAELLEQHDGDEVQAQLVFWGQMLHTLGIAHGRIGIYGDGAIHRYLEFSKRLSQALPAYQFVGEEGMTIFDEAFQTKDDDEIMRIRSVAARTTDVLQHTWDYIASHRADGERVVDADGEALTIGDVKRFVRRALLDRDLQDTDMIFAQGRDGGFPHSRGEDRAEIRVGEPIIFDLFPREIGGGYHHDVTRTWSIQSVKPDVQAAYTLVLNALEIAVDTFQPNIPAKALQEAVQTYLERHGHPTARSHPGTTTGYMHGLGHGVGLEIHERPRIGHLSKDTLAIGSVITLEPGLYYPEQGYGVRVEDTFYVDAHGSLVSISEFRKDIVLPLNG